jgi:hypothetical protein
LAQRAPQGRLARRLPFIFSLYAAEASLILIKVASPVDSNNQRLDEDVATPTLSLTIELAVGATWLSAFRKRACFRCYQALILQSPTICRLAARGVRIRRQTLRLLEAAATGPDVHFRHAAAIAKPDRDSTSCAACRRGFAHHYPSSHSAFRRLASGARDGLAPMCAGCGIDELPRNAHAVVGPTNAALEDVANTKLASHLADVGGLAFVLEAGMPGDDK